MDTVNFRKDEVWESFLGTETVELFQQNILHPFRFKKQVPEEIVKSYAIVEKLLLHSYSEYHFLDPALTKALSSFEMALKIKYHKDTRRQWRGNLFGLSGWFNERGYFENDCMGLLNALRSTRNSQSHPEHSFGGGIGLMGVFRHCNNLINDLYEDRVKRRQRKQEEKGIKEKLADIRINGAVAYLLGEKHIIYDAGIVFIDNKGRQNKYYGFFKKIFELQEESGKKHIKDPFLYFFETNQCSMEEGILTFSCDNDRLVTIDLNMSSVDTDEFVSWKKRFNSGSDYWNADLISTSKIDKYWLNAKNAFHFPE